MAKKIDKTEERIVAVEEAFSKTEQFIEKNQKIIMIVVGAIILIVLGYFGFKRLYLAPRERKHSRRCSWQKNILKWIPSPKH